MQQEQGFCNQNSIEYVEVNVIPSYRSKPVKKRPFHNPLKLVTKTSNQLAFFINPSIRQKLQDNFKLQHSSNIVYEVGKKTAFRTKGLLFDSNYENANLEYVISQDLKHYDLYIKPDTNTRQHFQWFCFKIKNGKTRKATFTIKNFVKQNMLYKDGLKPFYKSFSSSAAKEYHQLKTYVTYCKAKNEQQHFYQLSFTIQFQRAFDQIQLCSQPPYPYERYKKVFKTVPFARCSIAKSVLGHNIEAFLLNQTPSFKAVVVVFARQHPGESVGSWMMEGLVQKLTSEITTTDVFWILVPIVNVDGVIAGNNRTGVLGYDFNRHWYIDKDTNRAQLFPQILGLIKYFKKRQKEFSKKIKLFIDLHGHSSEANVFSYGPPHHKDSEYYELSRLLPFMISEKNVNFNFKQSNFEISGNKKYCARSVFFQRFGFQFSYTIESSFGIYNNKAVNQIDMLQMGKSICEAILDFCTFIFSMKKDKKRQHFEELFQVLKKEIAEKEKTCIDDSDSEQQDMSCPMRMQFESKIVHMLPDSTDSPHQKSSKNISDNDWSISSPSSNWRYRIKTQHSNISKMKSNTGECSSFLPRLKSSAKAKQASAEGSPLLQCSFESLSLSQIKQKLYSMRNSKFGKKLLIGSRF